MANLRITSTFPDSGESGVYVNTLIYATFDRDIEWNEYAAQYWINIIEDVDGATPHDGTVSRSDDQTRLIFTPSTDLKPSTKYRVNVYGGIAGVYAITNGVNVYLDGNQDWTFITGTSEGSGTSTQSTSPSPSGEVNITSYLTVSSTSMEDGATNQDVGLSSIYIDFNKHPRKPSGTEWEDYITITRKGVLGE